MGSVRFRLVTFNIAHGRGLTPLQGLTPRRRLQMNLVKIAALLHKLKPDVVALQEIDQCSCWAGNFDELEYLRRYLEEPDVHLALDPEFDMPNGEPPGTRIGTTPARDVNYAIDLLERIVIEKKLPPKVLIAHQFTMNMLPDKRNVQDSPVVDVALVMDGWGPRQLKHAIYRMVTRTPLEHSGIKLFYRKEPDLLSPSHVLELKPTPSIVIYQ